MMKKPEKLQKGDTIAIVSPSSGLAGEPNIQWRTQQGIENIKNLGYRVKVMEQALNTIEWNYNHPKERAETLTSAFKDPEVKAILCTIGGKESARIIPYLDDEIIQAHPKIFIGYSDITPLHLHLNQLGIISFYGPALLTDFAENVALDDYTLDHMFDVVSKAEPFGKLVTSDYVRIFGLKWDEENKNIARETKKNESYILVNGEGNVSGELIGGCFESLDHLRGSQYFPKLEQFDGKILFLENSEVNIEPWAFEDTFRSFGYMGIFDRIKGIILGRPQNGIYQNEYHQIIQSILKEFKQEDLPVIGNASFGHNEPKCTIPYGVKASISTSPLTFSIDEAAVSEKEAREKRQKE